MVSKQELLECSITNFIKFGSKRFSMNELASQLGISKKTIYKHFKTKDELITKGVRFIIDKYLHDVAKVFKKTQDPLERIILIQKKSIKYLIYFNPSFLFGLKKYYKNAAIDFEKFKENFVQTNLKPLLQEAVEKEYLCKDLNIDLFCYLYFLKLQNVVFEPKNLIDIYGEEAVFKLIVVNSLKGYLTPKYKDTNKLFS